MKGKFSLTFFPGLHNNFFKRISIFGSGKTCPKYKIESVQKGMQLKKMCLLLENQLSSLLLGGN